MRLSHGKQSYQAECFFETFLGRFVCLLKAYSLVISKLDLCEGGSFSPKIFNSDIEQSVSPFRVLCLSACRFVEGTFAGMNSHIVLCSRY